MSDLDRFTTAQLRAYHVHASRLATRHFESAQAIVVAAARIPWDDEAGFRRVMRAYRAQMAAGDEQMSLAYAVGAELLSRDAGVSADA